MNEPSAWLVRWAHLLPRKASVLDVAAGSGRHTRWLAARGHAVTAIDRDAAAMHALAGCAEALVADIEQGPWPLPGRRFDAVLVANYLWRPLLPTLVAAIGEGGLLVYETFASGHESVGRPANPDFLLGRSELLVAAAGLRVIAFEDGFLGRPDRFVQRLVAVREDVAAGTARYPLDGPSGNAGSVESIDQRVTP